MAIPQRFSLVTLGVADVEAATAFYRRLGWRQSTHSADGITFFATPGPIIALWTSPSSPSTAAWRAKRMPRRRRPSAASRSPSTSTPATRSTRRSPTGRRPAARSRRPAEETEWGGYSGYGRDPDGNLWEFAHNPFWPLDERGMPHLDGGEVD